MRDRSLKVPLPIVVLINVVVFCLYWGWYSSKVYLKVKRTEEIIGPENYKLKYKNVIFSTEDKITVKGWFIASPVNSPNTIILLHGLGMNKSNMLPLSYFLNTRGKYNLLYFDFRGHGKSGGKISSLGYLEQKDLKAAIKYLKEKKPNYCRKIGVYGVSLGAAVGLTATANNKDIKAVIAAQPFSSFNQMVSRINRNFYQVPAKPFDGITRAYVWLRLRANPEKYSPFYHIKKISPRPVFIIQFRGDPYISAEDSVKLFQAARNPKKFWQLPSDDPVLWCSRNAAVYQDKILGYFRDTFGAYPEAIPQEVQEEDILEETIEEETDEGYSEEEAAEGEVINEEGAAEGEVITEEKAEEKKVNSEEEE